MELPHNLHIIQDTWRDAVIAKLTEKPRTLHVTNSTFTKPEDVIRPTTLAGFQFIADTAAALSDTFFVAVNSDESMKIFTKDTVESQIKRAFKFAAALARQHPQREVITGFYDQETPKELYDALASLAKDKSLKLSTLHKWGGYGVGKETPIIVGAELFESVYAFPYYNPDEKPFCFDQTATGDQTNIVKVVSLYHTHGPHGDVYLSHDNIPKFRIA